MPKGIYAHKPRKTLEQRFREKFVQGAPEACWPWLGATQVYGYGVMYDYRRKRVTRAHRVAYELHHGITLPDGSDYKTVILHLCDNPACVNPDHLKLGPQKANVADMMGKNRGCVGSAHPWSKLTEATVRKYRRQIANGRRIMDISKETGIGHQTLSKMWLRQTWRHVP